MKESALLPLDSDQQAFAEDRLPLISLSAPPGSGKTQALSAKAISLIKSGTPADEILVMTFTNQAKEAFLERLIAAYPDLAKDPNLILEKPLHPTPTDPPRVWIGTFHETCLRILKCHAKPEGLAGDPVSIVSRDARWDLLHQSCVQTGTAPADPRSLEKFLWFLGGLFEALCTTGCDPTQPINGQVPLLPRRTAERTTLFNKINEQSAKTQRIFTTYQELLAASSEIDISDIPRKCVNLLSGDMNVRQAWSYRFKQVLADEYQDTTPLLTSMLGILGRHAEIAVCGDEDQSIFGWAGAAGTFLDLDRLEKTHGEPVQRTLSANWRLTYQLREKAAKLRKNGILIPAGTDPENQRQGPEPKHYVCKAYKDIPNLLAQHIQEKIQQNSKYHDCVVVCRTNKETTSLAESLSVLGIPVCFHRTKATSPLSEALVSWLNFAADPDSLHTPSNALKAAPSHIPIHEFHSPRRNATARKTTLLEQLYAAPDPRVFQKPLILCGSVLTVVRNLISRKPFPAGIYIDSVFRASGLQEYALHSQGPIKADFEVFLEQLKAASSKASGPEEICRIAGDMQPHQTEEISENRVAIRNMHQVKGNEWQHVFATGWQEGIFPNRDDAAEIIQERRVAYTAMTRASISFQSYSIASGKPSRYVNEAQMEIIRLK